jgi:hypothetical protein
MPIIVELKILAFRSQTNLAYLLVMLSAGGRLKRNVFYSSEGAMIPILSPTGFTSAGAKNTLSRNVVSLTSRTLAELAW